MEITKISGEAAIAGSQHIKERKYWLDKYCGEFEVSKFPEDVEDIDLSAFQMKEIHFTLNNALYQRLTKISNGSDTRLQMILTSMVAILLEKYTGKSDVMIGMPIFKQDQEDSVQFVNTILPLRMQIEGTLSFKEALFRVKDEIVESVNNQNYPMQTLLYQLGLEVSEDQYPLFDVALLLENIQQEKYIAGTKPNMLFSFRKTETEIEGTLKYNSARYQKESVERIVRHFLTVTEHAANNAGVPIQEIDILTEEEKTQLLDEFNNTKKELPDACSLYQLFEKQVLKTPEHIAIQFNGQALTYQQLNDKANQLAGNLRARGVKNGKPVVVLAERSLEMIVGILGVLKAGGCYVPVDCEYPEDRIDYIIKDSGTEILVTQSHLLYKVKYEGTILLLDKEDVYTGSTENLPVENAITDLAYIIYTSGSTGKPKGVAVEHRSIYNTLCWRKDYYQFTSEDVVLQIPSFAFDSSVEDIYTPLISGAKIVLIQQENRFNLDYLTEIIQQEKITHFLITPAFYKTLLDEIPEILKSLRIVTIAGDSFTEELVKEHFEKLGRTRLVNEYGPTENTVCTTFYEFAPDRTEVLIGTPISNVECYVLNKNKELCPLGVAGELCVSGAGVTRGYYNNKTLTQEKYLDNPFRDGMKMYCTGDLVCWLPNGIMKFMGRIDHQVKIRGYRIELGEIENCILKYKDIKEAYVMARDGDDSNKYLVAYFVGDVEISTSDLRKELLTELPEYMVPSHLMQLESLPLTNNGKVDRRKLPEPSKNVEYVEPANEVEEKLVAIWSEVLAKDHISVMSNFFEIGGHSLRATILISKVRKEFHVEFPLREIFSKPTIRQQAEYIQNGETSVYTAFTKVERKEYYPITASQKQMFILNQMDGISVTYNVPIGMVIDGVLDKEKVEAAFKILISRHDSLRTSFELIDGEPYQKVNDEVEFSVLEASATEENANEVVQSYVKRFDLSKAPLLHVALVTIEDKRSILLMDMHHIVSDGVSMDILVREFVASYEGKELPKQSLQYVDYVAWKNDTKNQSFYKEQEKFWLDCFAGELPVLNLHTDYPRPAVQSYEGDKINFEADVETKDRLQALANEKNATLFMVLLSAYDVLLSKYTGQEDIVVGSPIAGRSHPDSENIVGMFVNSLSIRNFPKADLSFSEFLVSVREHVMKVYENQDYPYNELVEKLDIPRDISRNPLFDTMFVMQNMNIPDVLIDGKGYQLQDFEGKITKFDLTLMALEVQGKLELSFQYNTNLFKSETVNHFAEHFLNVLKQIIKNPDMKIADIQLLSKEEQDHILCDFNQTKMQYEEKTIHELFEQQATIHNQNVCVVSEEGSMTYGEVNERANQLAHTLSIQNVGTGSIVAIMAEKSQNLIISILAVLKTGAAYLPIDPIYPAERVKYMLEDSKACAFLTQKGVGDEIAFDGLVIDVECEASYDQNKDNLGVTSHINDLAYIIYTSGSTGKPKGVMVGHRGIASLKVYFEQQFNISEQERILQFASCSFDASVWEMFMALLTGASLYLVSKDVINNITEMENYLNKNEITVVTLPPVYLASLMPKHIHTLKKLITAGQAAQAEIADKWKEKVTYINAYGPTETTICATTHTYKEKNAFGKVLIGKPIYNTQVYILDANNHVQPIGVCGELCVAGDILAKGYLNRESLTEQSFVDNPFAEGQKMYKTGDYARWLPNGEIEYIGRMDQQIKIRGYRVELGEIEEVMLTYDGILQVAVNVVVEDNQSQSLCAYYVADNEIDKNELRNVLAKSLPDYMIPKYFVQLEEMPLTSSGKIDTKKLVEYKVESAEQDEYIAPATEIETKIAAIWMDLLNKERVGRNDNFFLLGGDSISMIKITSAISKEFAVNIGFKEFMESKTLSTLSSLIASKMGQEGDEIDLRVEPDKEHMYEPFPLTEVQMAYLMGRDDSFDMGGIGTHIYTEIEFELDINRFRDCVKKVIRRHPMLRAVVYEDGTQQILKDVPDFEVKIEDISAMNEAEQEAYLEQNRNAMSHQVFETDKWPLFEFKAIKTSKDKEIYLLCGSIDALIADGSSLQLAVSDGVQYYQNPDVELPEIEFTFRDYVLANEEFKKSDSYHRDKEFWENKLEGFPPAPELPLVCEPESISKPHFSRHSLLVPKAQWDQIKERAKKEEVTPSALLCTAYASILSKWSNQSDLTVNLTVYSRLPFHEDVENIIGDFTSVILVDAHLDKELSFWENARVVQKVLMDSLEHRNYDGVNFSRDFIKHNNLSKQKAVMPYVFTSVLYNNGSSMFDKIDSDKIKMGISQTSQVYIDNQASEINGCLSVNWDYVDQIFDKEMIDSMFEQYQQFIMELMVPESEPVMAIPENDEKLIEKYNDTAVERSVSRLEELFCTQAKKNPDKIALELYDEKVSYGKLDQMSNQVAQYLSSQGVKPGDYVGVISSHSINAIINVLGVLKAGASYVPIDKDYPEARKEYIKEQCNCSMVIKSSLYDEKGLETYSSEALSIATSVDDVAYVIFTSGSTGKPKGVVITHKAAANTILDINERYQIQDTDKLIGLSSMCFDLSVYDIFGALSTGATLVLIEDVRDVNEVMNIVKSKQVTIWNSVPAIMALSIDSMEGECDSLRLVMLSGDWIPLNLPEKIKQVFKNAQIISLGGATEASIWSIYYPVTEVKDSWKSIPYGYPLSNQTFYVLDYAMNSCPVGVQGELYIGGDGVANGYMNDKEKTDNSFIMHEKYGRLYKTGDYGVLTKEGYIEFRGRKDQQVKIGGFRIELGEIENCLMEYDGIKNAIVIDREENGGKKYLCAYYVAEQEYEVTQLKDFLLAHLPDYMLPVYYICIKEIPVTTNGKVDRKALPVPEKTVAVAEQGALPANDAERKLLALFQDTVKIDPIDVMMNFFELGINSINLMQIKNAISKQLGIDISFKEILKADNIRNLTAYLASKEVPQSDSASMQYTADKEHRYDKFPLTDLQFAYLMGRGEQMELGGIGTHSYIEIKTHIDIERFNASLKKLIEHQPMLHTIIYPDGYQQILENIPEYNIPVTDLTMMTEVERNEFLLKEREYMSHYVFQPDHFPLFDFRAYKVDEDTHYLFVGFDLLIADGASMLVMTKELLEFYNEPELVLPELEFTFRDYVLSVNKFKKSEAYEASRQYWQNKLPDFPMAPALPMVTDPQKVGKPHFSRLTKIVGKEDWRCLKEIARKNNVTTSALLCTAYAKVLSMYSNQSRLALNLTVFNRPDFHEDINRMIGDFTSIIIVDIDFSKGGSLMEDTIRVRDTLLEDIEHSSYDGVEFIRDIAKYNNLGNTAVMPVVFTSMLFSLDDSEQEQSNSSFWGEVTMGISQTPQVYLDHQVSENDGELSLTWDYVEDLFDYDMIKSMFNQYVNIVTDMINAETICDVKPLEDSELAVAAYNNTEKEIAVSTLDAIFEEQARKYPDRKAVIFEDSFISYKELDEKSNQVARYLMEQGVIAGDFVGISGKRCISTIVLMMGIIKAGAAYVPVDPEYPEDRKAYILSNSKCKCFLDEDVIERINNSDIAADKVEKTHKPDDRAYVIYTSGSTGKPKGVVITHKAVVNTILDINERFEVSFDDKVIGLSSMCFDLSVYDIFGALCAGAALVLIHDVRDMSDIAAIVKKEEITVWNSVPAIMELFIENLKADNMSADEVGYWQAGSMDGLIIDYETLDSLRVVMLSGDWIPVSLPDKINELCPFADVYSLGGATEASIWSIYYKIEEVQAGLRSIPYGYPLSNQKFYVLDYNNEICPVGVLGELYIGGDGLAQCYLNDIEKTNAAFIIHPKFGRIYRTGDYGILTKNGYIEFMGRKDFQVKVRGHRIELGEIENVIMEMKEIQSCVVIDKTDANNRTILCAYLVSASNVSPEKVRAEISKKLADYMIPQYIKNIGEIPLTPNGKIDRKALPDPQLEDAESIEYVAPRNETETKVQSVWQKVLGIEQISVKDNYFMIGGNSVKAMQIVVELSKDYEISINDMFAFQTIRDISNRIVPKKDVMKQWIQQMKEMAASGKLPSEEEECYWKDAQDEYFKKIASDSDFDVLQKAEYENVFVTGGTGYLGTHLIYELLTNTLYNVYVLVRAKSEDSARERVEQNLAIYFDDGVYNQFKDRIHVVIGDVTLKALGIAEDVYEELSNTIDCIIHAAATVKHFGQYDEFKKINIQGTKKIVDFALLNKKKDVHYISTKFIADGTIKEKSYMLMTEYDYNLGQESDNFYIQSKLEAEKIVIGAREAGLNTCIYRIGNIVFDTESGKFQKNKEDNAFYNIINAFLKIGSFPRVKLPVKYDFTYVDYVRKAIVKLFDRKNLQNQIYHIFNPKDYELTEIGEMIRESGFDISIESLDEFFDHMSKAAQDESLKPYINTILMGAVSPANQNLTSYQITAERTCRILKELGLEWLEMDAECVRKMMLIYE